MIAIPAPIKTKVCKSCGQRKPVGSFHKRKANRDGRATRCNACCTAARLAPSGKAAVVPATPASVAAGAAAIKAANLKDKLDRRRRAPIGSPLAVLCRGYYREWRKAKRRQTSWANT